MSETNRTPYPTPNAIPDFYKPYLDPDTDYRHICSHVDHLLDLVAMGKIQGNLLILDCFWQMEEPLDLLEKLDKDLQAGQTVTFIEPLLSPISYLRGCFTHPLQLDHKAKPFQQDGKVNLATPSLLFDRIENRLHIQQNYPHLTFHSRERLNLFTGIASHFPNWLPKIKKVDDFLMPFLGNFAANHMKVILGRKT